MYKAQVEFLMDAASKLSDKSINMETDELITCLKKIKVLSCLKNNYVLHIADRMFSTSVNYV